MAKGYKALLAEADALVTSLEVGEVAEISGDDGYRLIDIRDVREVERDGMLPGAILAPRGMLEFWIDPESPYHKPFFAEDKAFVFYCASGWRSLLAARTAQEMGLNVISMRGGFSTWKKAGLPVSAREKGGKAS
ncbi:rhodanese-like domain-containing protein [Salipiger sp. P9]|uniref:rhodanese-like domain-containing protein n=1 Tax=Salipiger pentaromativorans TaxID=2943193 RepID=UPI0021571A1C|nr:rhodanese-like domain-containing protein [Salipiger pentaromativorans]MCR8547566.1 rhodanese-like domain-containing protein [Salipiger pentaromativorans]